MRRSNKALTVVFCNLGIIMALFALPASANLLENGDFEDTTGWQPAGGDASTAPAGWRDSTLNNATSPQSGTNAIGGSGTSAFILRNAGASEPGSTSGRIRQDLDQQSGPIYEWAFDFASEDPGGAGNRSLSLATWHGEFATTAIMRIVDVGDNGVGDWQVFSGGAWQTALEDSIVFDDDVTESPLEHHFSMIIDSTATPPSYDLRITDSNGAVHELLGSTLFNGAGPGPVNQGGIGIEFNNQLASIDVGVLVDNVSLLTIPEPATLGLLAGLGPFLLWGRRGRSRP